jgi:hypothetical protein
VRISFIRDHVHLPLALLATIKVWLLACLGPSLASPNACTLQPNGEVTWTAQCNKVLLGDAVLSGWEWWPYRQAPPRQGNDLTTQGVLLVRLSSAPPAPNSPSIDKDLQRRGTGRSQAGASDTRREPRREGDGSSEDSMEDEQDREEEGAQRQHDWHKQLQSLADSVLSQVRLEDAEALDLIQLSAALTQSLTGASTVPDGVQNVLGALQTALTQLVNDDEGVSVRLP